MKNHDYLLKCTQLIEDKMQSGPSGDWIDYHYTKLHEQIFEVTKTSISVRTLKRIFKVNDNYEPQIATKNAMAQYLGYKDWAFFLKENYDNDPKPAESPAPVIKPEITTGNRRLKVVFFAAGALLLIILIVGIKLFFNRPNVIFNVKNTLGHAPLTAAISYDLSNLDYKNAFIDFGSGGEYKLLLGPKGELTYQYKTPNFYKIRLIADGRVFAKNTVDVQTNGWVCYVGNNDQNARVVTDSNKFSDKSSLYFAPSIIGGLNINTKEEYWVDYRNIKNFHVDGDQMTVEFRLRNSQDMGGFDCFDTSLEFTGESGRGRFKFVKPGCTQFADTEFGDTQLTGNFHNLSSLGVDLSKWTVVRIETRNKTSMVYINNVFKYKTVYNVPIGNIRGLFCRFKGSGQLDFIRVYGRQHHLIYGDEFNH
ncbi:hypothetical protein [Mucilaginibacter rubeus]|uniref:Uncharacterized protein n=1 Tax=Mucilaginibacter rubeus TaxID=2027860 RepID=A0A5C1HX34_9SPHI|nr:hypothetical protein [Mucilaginibacter rubeus]QEM09989.1 hypothetical protein DEO27_008125 [Mucilaginibacter rubeus]